jgi:hypothetical protein
VRNQTRPNRILDKAKSSASLCLLWLSSACTVFEPPIQDSEKEMDPDDVKMDGGAEVEDSGTAQEDAAPQGMQDASSEDSGAEDAAPDAPEEQQDTGPVSCALTGVDLMDQCTGQIVINEIDGSGDDYIEIYNRGETAVNLSNYVLADDSGGNPDVADGVVIPAGTVLEPKRFLYVWANIPPDPTYTGPDKFYDDCIAGAPPPCLHIDWGVSASGERVYLLNDALQVICALSYPNAVFGGEALGRIPDGSDVVCPTMPTAGELNEPSTLR